MRLQDYVRSANMVIKYRRLHAVCGREVLAARQTRLCKFGGERVGLYLDKGRSDFVIMPDIGVRVEFYGSVEKKLWIASEMNTNKGQNRA